MTSYPRDRRSLMASREGRVAGARGRVASAAEQLFRIRPPMEASADEQPSLMLVDETQKAYGQRDVGRARRLPFVA